MDESLTPLQGDENSVARTCYRCDELYYTHDKTIRLVNICETCMRVGWHDGFCSRMLGILLVDCCVIRR